MRIYFYYSFLSMDKESVGFLIFHNRSHRVEHRFRKFLYQLVIKVVTDFAGLVENHGCLVTRGRCRPLRERWSIRTAISGKIDPGSGHAFLETVGFTWDVADSHSVDVVEYEWNLSTVPCGFSPVNQELISKLVGIGRCFRKL